MGGAPPLCYPVWCMNLLAWHHPRLFTPGEIQSVVTMALTACNGGATHVECVQIGWHEPGTLQLGAHEHIIAVNVGVAIPLAQEPSIYAVLGPEPQVLLHQGCMLSS